jgi:hypothetical protein
MSAFEQSIDPSSVVPAADSASDSSANVQPLNERCADAPVHEAAPSGQNQDVQPPTETAAQKRRQQRIALIQELGGPSANFKGVALEALRRGFYSPSTNLGDIESALIRTWRRRRRAYNR